MRLASAAPECRRGLERVSPSQLEGGPRVNLAQRLRLDTGAALDRGSLLHAWLAEIEWLDAGEPSDARLTELASPWAAASLDVAALIPHFRTMLARPAIRELLTRPNRAKSRKVAPTATVWRERPFALRHQDMLHSGRIDRLVVQHDGDRAVGAEVIDFKTDDLPADPGAIRARLEVYRPQVEVYRRAAAALTGVPADRIAVKIALLEPGEVRSVP